MAKYIVKRIVLAIVSIFIVSAITFFVMNAIPGGPFNNEKATSAAAQKALQSVGCLLLDSHMHSCVTTRIREGDDAVIDELSALMRKLK